MAVARKSLIAVLLTAPLSFGAVQAWAWGSMSVLMAFTVVLWAVGCVRSSAVQLRWSPLYIPAAAFLGLLLVQFFAGLTTDRMGTREALVKWVLSLLIFFLTQHLWSGSEQKSWVALAAVIAAYSFALALLAIIQFLMSPELLYGIVRPASGGDVFGPYVNHNHYAGLFEVLLPAATGCAISLPLQHPAKAVAWFGVLLALASVFLSGSRGGVIAVSVEVTMLAVVVWLRAPLRSERKRVVIPVLVLAALLGGALFWLDQGHAWRRWEQVAKTPRVAAEDRVRWTSDTLRMARRHWLAGVGVGAFETAYPQFQTFESDLVVDYAHNDYAQLLAEGGVVGFMTALATIGMFGFLSLRSLRSMPLTHTAGLQLGATVGVWGVLVHSFSDFNLHIPANAVWVAFALAVATIPPAGITASCAIKSASTTTF